MERSNKHIDLKTGAFWILFPMLFLFLFKPLGVRAQRDEFGIGLGAMNYAGDMIRGYQLEAIRPGGGVYYKFNLSNIIGFRFGLMGGMLSGSDKHPIDAFAEKRNGSFQTGIIEISALFEYSFFDIRNEKSNIKWTPYIFLGVGAFTMIGGNVDTRGKSITQPVFPFGIGAKHVLSKRLTLNFEIGLRKLFFDYLDGYSDGDITVKNYQYGNKYDDDWYNYVGISVSYLLYEIPCPFDFY
jgi:hypothetical protein